MKSNNKLPVVAVFDIDNTLLQAMDASKWNPLDAVDYTFLLKNIGRKMVVKVRYFAKVLLKKIVTELKGKVLLMCYTAGNESYADALFETIPLFKEYFHERAFIINRPLEDARSFRKQITVLKDRLTYMGHSAEELENRLIMFDDKAFASESSLSKYVVTVKGFYYFNRNSIELEQENEEEENLFELYYDMVEEKVTGISRRLMEKEKQREEEALQEAQKEQEQRDLETKRKKRSFKTPRQILLDSLEPPDLLSYDPVDLWKKMTKAEDDLLVSLSRHTVTPETGLALQQFEVLLGNDK